MLSSISWQHYLLLVSSLTSAYYAVVISLYYKGELLSFFSEKQELSESEPRSEHSILGEAREISNSVAAEELQFSSESSEFIHH
ncbi:hypothetical protein WG906_03205 [Pedobacter sp. P351]|uniref:hypothetical protein n=1 Tax=Pedobacter superstes TaxID=3133441 RepID=UPI0030B1ADAA